MRITIIISREVDGRWIGEAAEIPGVLVYGRTRKEARHKAETLAQVVLQDRLESQVVK